jgi:WD40 repeat protein
MNKRQRVRQRGPLTVAMVGLSATLRGHTESVQSVAFSPNEKILASASQDRTVKLWDLATGRCTATLDDAARDLGGRYRP